jgi:hypothetical protein
MMVITRNAPGTRAEKRRKNDDGTSSYVLSSSDHVTFYDGVCHGLVTTVYFFSFHLWSRSECNAQGAHQDLSVGSRELDSVDQNLHVCDSSVA